jgi:hypothetical protein
MNSRFNNPKPFSVQALEGRDGARGFCRTRAFFFAGLWAAIFAISCAFASGGGGDPAGKTGASDAVLKALRSYLYAHYDVRLFGERVKGRITEEGRTRLKELEARQAAMRGKLLEAMEAKGIIVEREQPIEIGRLAERLRDYFIKYTNYAFLVEEAPFKGGFHELSLVRVVKREPEKSLRLWGRDVTYARVVFDRVEILDYSSYVRRAPGTPAAGSRSPGRGGEPMILSRGKIVYVNSALIREVGRKLFFSRLSYYRALERRVEEEGWLDTLLERGEGENLLAALKDYLRWRSLRDLAEKVKDMSEDERLAAFERTYGKGEEMRAAAYRLFPRLQEAVVGAKSGKERLRARAEIEKKVLFTQIRYGDPRGAMASILALHLQGKSRSECQSLPCIRAAESILVDLDRIVKAHTEAFPHARPGREKQTGEKRPVGGVNLSLLASLWRFSEAEYHRFAEYGFKRESR